MASLEGFAFPRIGQIAVPEVTSADVLEVLAPIWHEKPPTARYVRWRIRAVLEWAVAMEFRTDNPCDRIDSVLGPHHHVVEHLRALPHREVGSAVESVRETKAPPVLKLVFEFLVLTVARWSEVRLAEWAEIDRAAGVWTVPETRMKTRREHRVPLCGRAMEIIEEARDLGGGGPLVFSLEDGKPMSRSGCAACSANWGSRPCRTGSGRRSGTGRPMRRTIPGRPALAKALATSVAAVGPATAGHGSHADMDPPRADAMAVGARAHPSTACSWRRLPLELCGGKQSFPSVVQPLPEQPVAFGGELHQRQHPPRKGLKLGEVDRHRVPTVQRCFQDVGGCE